jgi:hypothetical protein
MPRLPGCRRAGGLCRDCGLPCICACRAQPLCDSISDVFGGGNPCGFAGAVAGERYRQGIHCHGGDAAGRWVLPCGGAVAAGRFERAGSTSGVEGFCLRDRADHHHQAGASCCGHSVGGWQPGGAGVGFGEPHEGLACRKPWVWGGGAGALWLAETGSGGAGGAVGFAGGGAGGHGLAAGHMGRCGGGADCRRACMAGSAGDGVERVDTACVVRGAADAYLAGGKLGNGQRAGGGPWRTAGRKP